MTEMHDQKNVLMIAFHFPPDASIGAQRTFKTAEYLPEFGWNPTILTAKDTAYAQIEGSQTIPPRLLASTHRAPALDVYRHLTFMGKHLGWMATIDRWTTWVPCAIWKGVRIIRKNKPDLIWSTAPIPSAHIIAAVLSKMFNIPWVSDYRDPSFHHQMTTTKLRTRILKRIDDVTMENCAAAVFTTRRASKLYRDLFQGKFSNKIHTVENGYDEQNWERLSDHQPIEKSPISQDKFSLFYSGVLYPNGRDPTSLFRALQLLKENEGISADSFELVFQGAGDGKNYQGLIETLGISDMVKFTPAVPYLDSLICLGQANALVVIQGEEFACQIPGKLYECIRSGKPIIVIAPNDSSTASAALHYPASTVAYSHVEISKGLLDCINRSDGTPDSCDASQFSRQRRTAEMADIFNGAAGLCANRPMSS